MLAEDEFYRAAVLESGFIQNIFCATDSTPFGCRTGEYMVTLLAKNPLGHKEVTRTVFILTHVCRPPSVKIVGLEQVNSVSTFFNVSM